VNTCQRGDGAHSCIAVAVEQGLPTTPQALKGRDLWARFKNRRLPLLWGGLGARARACKWTTSALGGVRGLA
jgi:hypothetical protein